MPPEIPIAAIRDLKNRRALLWVCQRYDLEDARNPHTYDFPPNQAKLLYRAQVTNIDESIASQYWESVWLEGADSPVLKSLREKGRIQSQRPVVELAGTADADTAISAEEFLPIWILPGLLDNDKPRDAQYGILRRRARERIAFHFASRLQDFPGRTLFVVGAHNTSDLDLLYDVLADLRVLDFRVMLIWPPDTPPPSACENPVIETVVWPGLPQEFVAAVGTLGAPSSADAIRWTIRLKKGQIDLPARDVHRVLDRFALITEHDLVTPDDFTMDELREFLHGHLDTWKGYAAGLVVPRDYHTAKEKTLAEEVLETLRRLSGEDEDSQQLTHVVELPASGGAGSTTLARAAAYEAAQHGYPVVILRPDEVDLDRGALSAFATSLSGFALQRGLAPPPLMVVLDQEHHHIAARRELAAAFASEGRRLLILQVVPFDESDTNEVRQHRYSRLAPLMPSITNHEVQACHTTFSEIAARYNLAMHVPNIREWEAFRQSDWTTPDGQASGECPFWVALEFFLTTEMDFTDAEQARDALGQWIKQRMESVTDDRMLSLIRYVAAMSTFRLASPLWTVLRPVTGGVFSSELVEVLRQLRDLVAWGTSQTLEDEILRFVHPSIAAEILRREGVRSIQERVSTLKPLLSQLSAGSVADQWVCESVAVLASPSFEEKQAALQIEWDWRLDFFEDLPPLVRDSSKLILHHWARALYLSAEGDADKLPLVARRERLEAAIDKLNKAIELPRREGRDEHPSHLYNTLGAAYSRYSRFLEETEGRTDQVADSWNSACEAFEKAISLSGGVNVDALLAFSRRLIDGVCRAATMPEQVNEQQAAELLRALQLLDEAGEIVNELPNPAPGWDDSIQIYRQDALHWLGRFTDVDSLQQLIDRNPSIGYYCRARLRVQNIDDMNQISDALSVFQDADHAEVEFGGRAILFRLTLMRRHKQFAFDFAMQRHLYEKLERIPDHEPRPVDQFRHAVLCYQCGDYSAGSDRFRRLREVMRRSDFIPPRLREVLRDPQSPHKPRVLAMRVDRLWNEWKAEGFVEELNESVPFRPRHFANPPRIKEIVPCVIRFLFSGPKAVPERFEV